MTLREQLVILEREARSKYYSSVFREVVAALDERDEQDELLRRAADLIGQFMDDMDHEAGDRGVCHEWLTDYNAMMVGRAREEKAQT